MRIKHTINHLFTLFFIIQPKNVLSKNVSNVFQKYSVYVKSDFESAEFTVTVSGDKNPKNNPYISIKKPSRARLERYLSENQSIEGLDLRELDLSGLEIDSFTGCKLDNKQIRFLISRGFKNISANLLETDLDLEGINLEEISFREAQLTGDQALYLIDQGANIKQSFIMQADFREKNLRNIDFEQIIFVQTTFEGADLSETNMSNSQFMKCNFTRTNLTRSNLTRASIQLCNLRETDFTEANLEETDLMGEDLIKVKFIRSNLTKACFELASLKNTDLSHSNLKETNFKDSRLTNINLKKVHLNHTMFDKSKISGVKGVSYTKLIFIKFISK